ncbi:TIGR01777 family oxidoreductase [Xanthomonas sp. XNM01]|uniref:TIGR01777 family oxidoreductase n=1 Tax=Xanthomonas sp. XNM01 TaxID=2769289 RepID=UPI00178505FD|nr:TIGR01777 family oxidoreductase [Xanthomonas sp. XNM01]MBD9369754.1 TIGR01777 family protein [Xanthomonas sp. XNM01]
MDVLVTGGTGFIGRPLCARLLADGHRVTVLSRSPARFAAAMPQVRLVDRLETAGRAEAVVNLAGEGLSDGRWTAARKRRFRQSRLDTTARLHDWIAAQPGAQRPRVLVSGSAIGFYGDRGDTALDETATPGDDFAAQLCRDWEAQALRVAALGPRVCLLRTGIVLAADGGALARMLPPFRLGAGGRFGDGRHWMSWIHRDDLVALVAWLLQGDLHGPFNGTAPEPVRNDAFVRELAGALHRPALLPLPATALRLAFGEMADLLLASQRVLPQRAQQAGFAFRHPGLAEALQEILR